MGREGPVGSGALLHLTPSPLWAKYTTREKSNTMSALRWVHPKYVFHGCCGEENIFIVPLVPCWSIV